MICPNKICNDAHPYLIAMWKALQQGWIPPETITEEEYKYIKQNMNVDKALTGFVGFGCSFGGKWFAGLARNSKNENYCDRANKSLLKDFQGLKNAVFSNLDYRDVVIPDGSIVYCDPPYKNTTEYCKELGKFDTDAFWEYIRHISVKNTVFVSEQIAPDDFECIWSKNFTRNLDVNKNNTFVVEEKLFTFTK